MVLCCSGGQILPRRQQWHRAHEHPFKMDICQLAHNASANILLQPDCNIGCHVYAFHSGKQALDGWELAMMVLSALEWKNTMDQLTLWETSPSLNTYAGGAFLLYDRHIEVEVPDCVDQKVFGPQSKLYAYQVIPDRGHGLWILIVLWATPSDYSADVIAAHYDDATGYLEA